GRRLRNLPSPSSPKIFLSSATILRRSGQPVTASATCRDNARARTPAVPADFPVGGKVDLEEKGILNACARGGGGQKTGEKGKEHRGGGLGPFFGQPPRLLR